MISLRIKDITLYALTTGPGREEKKKEIDREVLENELFIYLSMYAKPFHIINI